MRFAEDRGVVPENEADRIVLGIALRSLVAQEWLERLKRGYELPDEPDDPAEAVAWTVGYDPADERGRVPIRINPTPSGVIGARDIERIKPILSGFARLNKGDVGPHVQIRIEGYLHKWDRIAPEGEPGAGLEWEDLAGAMPHCQAEFERLFVASSNRD